MLYPTGCCKKNLWELVFGFLEWFLQIIFTIHVLLFPKPAIGDISSHRLIFDPLLSLLPCIALSYRLLQKNCENWFVFDFFTVISTDHFYKSSAVISKTCDRRYLITQTDFWPTAYTIPLCCSIQQSTTKNSENWLCFDFFTLIFTHLIHNSYIVIPKTCNWGYLIPQTNLYGPNTLPPSDDIRKWRHCKKNHENVSRSE